ncbi:MAG: protein kinase [Kiritimatiellae bacterium]|nr:protein kinase [Kiritimatiellia bacterium]
MESVDEANIITEPVSSAACPNCGEMLDVEGLEAFSVVQCPACNHAFPIPARFGPFLLLQLLGAGGMGGVYRAKDEGLNREIAVKVMLKSLGDDPQFVESFQREAQAAAKLNHPHIAQIYSFGQEKGQPYIAMELVDGGSLEKMIKERGALDPALVIHVGLEIAEGLAVAADAGLVHGDIKPENILFDRDNNAKLVDFGLSAMQSGPGEEVWGTPYYIAPEKVRRQKSDYRADIYSLGGTLYHAIAGIPPFEGEDASAVVRARFDGPAQPLHEIRKGIAPEVEALINRMLEVDPNTRYPTYGSLIGDMKRYLATVGPVNVKARSRKIVIKGKNRSAALTGELADLPPGMVPVEPDAVPEETAEEAGRRGCRMIVMIMVSVLVGLAALGGGIWYLWYHTQQKGVAKEFAVIETNQNKIRSAIAGFGKQSSEWVKKLEPLPAEALGYAKTAGEIAVQALGEEACAGMVPEEPAYTFDEAKPAAEDPKAAPAGEKPAEPAAEKPAEPVAEKPAGDEGAASDQPSAKIVKRVRELYEEAYRVKRNCLFAQKVEGEITGLIAEAEKIQSPAKPTEEAVEEMKEIEEKLVALNKKIDLAYKQISQSRELLETSARVAKMKKEIDGIKADLATLLDQKKQAQAAAEKAAKEKAEAEKKAAEAAAQEEKQKEELAKVAEVEAGNIGYIKALDFRNAARTLNDLADEVTGESALQALKIAQERVNRLEQFHTFLVEQTEKGYKVPAGWSVTSADKRNIVVNGHKLPWTDLYTKPEHTRRLVELINGLILSPTATKNMKLRERTQAMTNASLFLFTFYKDNASAKKMASDLATKAAEAFDLDADLIKQLVPEAFE